MQNQNLPLGLLVALATLCVGLCQEGNAANFTCEETAPATAPHVSYRFWLLPSGKLLYPTSQGTELVKVLDRGQVLTVSDVSDARNFGTYYCLVYDAAQYEFRVGSKHVIDASPLYYTFFKQDSRIFGKMMGAAAFGILSVICLVLVGMVIWTNRRVVSLQADPEQAGKKAAGPRCCINLGFLSDGTGCCQKPPPYHATLLTTGSTPQGAPAMPTVV